MEKQAEIELRPEDRGDDYDAIVVGSGYGGSVAACRMSTAGIKVCLLEKGRRWKAEDFPTDIWKIMSAVRYQNQNLGIRFGPEDALFQLHEQNDSLAAVACGLGGGSLINAGVMLPTPIRARRNLKWPKEWERDWDVCESSAAAMLRIQSSSVKFPIAKVMGEIAEAEFEANIESSVKLSVNFDVEEPPSNPPRPEQINSCFACGNCLAGYRSTAVHLLGGCNASSDSSGGVCNHKGQVFDPKTPATVACRPLLLRAIEKDRLHVIDGKWILCVVDGRTPYTQYMHYRLLLAAASGSRYILEGKKIMNPFQFALYAWRETTTLYVTFNEVAQSGSTDTMLNLKGELEFSFTELLKLLYKP
uniref:Long-chain-alcohol oxidase FAO1-like n=1 Tax=Populus alba TaxID=43335 RepID=A0A4U5P4S3_POPAL|nr:long-chain-alcohol oxidase FAO1-like [Populus alba]